MDTIAETEEQRIRDMHSQGNSLTKIAKELNRSKAFVSTHAQQMGLDFARSQTKNATKAHQADAASRRAELALRLLREADRFLDLIHQPSTVYVFAANGRYAEHVMPTPPPTDIRNLMTAAGIAIQRSLELDKADQRADAGTSVLDDFLHHLGVGA